MSLSNSEWAPQLELLDMSVLGHAVRAITIPVQACVRSHMHGLYAPACTYAFVGVLDGMHCVVGVHHLCTHALGVSSLLRIELDGREYPR